MGEYKLTLLDREGYSLAEDSEIETLAEAKRRAVRGVRDSEYLAAGLLKAEVRANGVVVFERWVK